jgi:hypothetical protein
MPSGVAGPAYFAPNKKAGVHHSGYCKTVVKILHSYIRFPLPYRNQNLNWKKRTINFSVSHIHYTPLGLFIAIDYSKFF